MSSGWVVMDHRRSATIGIGRDPTRWWRGGKGAWVGKHPALAKRCVGQRKPALAPILNGMSFQHRHELRCRRDGDRRVFAAIGFIRIDFSAAARAVHIKPPTLGDAGETPPSGALMLRHGGAKVPKLLRNISEMPGRFLGSV